MADLKPKRGALTAEVVITAKVPPTEFRIFSKGAIETTKGVFLFNDEAATLVLAAAADYGNEYCLDYCHAMMTGPQYGNDPAEAGKAAGWYGLELRNGELWAVKVRWTPAAAEKLIALEFRYTSPAFDYRSDGTIIELLNVALTNTPATKDLEPLMASRDTGRRAQLEKPMNPEMLKALAKALGLAETATPEEMMAAAAKLAAPAPIVPAEVVSKCAKCGGVVDGDDKFCATCGAPVTPAVEAVDPALPPAVQAQMTRMREQLAVQTEANRTTQAQLERVETERLTGQFVTEAAGYKALAQDPKKFGLILLSLSRKAPEELVAVREVLAKANAALAGSVLLGKAGRGGSTATGDETASAKLERLVTAELSVAQPNGKKLSRAQASSRVIQREKGLYAEVQAEEKAAE